jgi:hypothetical protein
MEFKTKTETVGGVEYTLTEPEGGVALGIQEQFSDESKSPDRIRLWGDTVLATTMGISVDDLRKLPLSHYNEIQIKLSPIALELFGLKVVAPGEAQVGASPTD